MGLLSNGSDLLGISPYLQQAIIGAVIILAVSFDELRKRKRSLPIAAVLSTVSANDSDDASRAWFAWKCAPAPCDVYVSSLLAIGDNTTRGILRSPLAKP